MSDEKYLRLDVELIRIVSAFGIVWFHSGIEMGRDIAYAGLVCFVILSAFFSIISNTQSQIFDRTLRILTPCIIWSFFYTLLKIVTGVEVFPTNYNIVNALLATPSIHLWYLPFIFFGTLAIYFAKKYFSRNEIGILSGAISLILILTAPKWRSLSYLPPWGQYLHALPALLFGFFLGCYKDTNATIRGILFISILLAITVMALKGINGFGITYFFGFIPCLLLLKNGPMIDKSNSITKLSKATFGVYLIHIFSLSAIMYFGIYGIFLPILSFTISVVVVMVARRYLPNMIVKYAL